MEASKAKWSLYSLAKRKPYRLVWLSGLMLAASFPPSPLNPLIFIAFVPLLILCEVTPHTVLEDKTFLPFKKILVIIFRILTLQFLWRPATWGTRVAVYDQKEISGNAQIFRYTYTAFFIWNLLCCYWLSLTALGAQSMGEAVVNATAGVLAVTINPLLMSIPFQLYARVRSKFSPLGAAGWLICFWIAFELFHFRWELSWSWLTLGHALSTWPAWVQYIEITGVLGTSLHVLLANVLVYSLLRHHDRTGAFARKKLGLALGWIALPLLLAPLFLYSGRAVFQPVGKYRVRVVQPVIDPFSKYNNFTWTEQIHLFADLIRSTPPDSLDLVVMPETAIPKTMTVDALTADTILKPLWRVVDTFQLPILTGMEEYAFFYDEASAPLSAYPRRVGHEFAWVENYNAATLLRPDRRLETVRKSYLVPMVERMPFLGVLGFLRDYNIDMGTGMGGYGKPDSVNLLEMPDGTSIRIMICYESEFSDHVRQLTAKGAQMLTVITNDGWWSQSSGYIQHAAMANLRAIENRRDIARAANTGRSLFVDARGYSRQETDWWKPGIIDGEVNLYNSRTLYVLLGDYVGWLAVLGALTGVLWGAIRGRRIPASSDSRHPADETVS